ncbi:hypothetical protein BU14_0271s0006 [Porphyra umbilicalis]|uniref:Uncharacterized protein n=1 Tax=Porphyra umbilicalis TaxID=2786 RepID=A0A1X6P1E7_PORUM|nr:hypothetical protein BU14_0271s0006 [Porphyra umbilicalis]|eukprot:OSX74711.1 hypothetical protein BU14_0271s0006 [Porphyra umbilicalis]
MCACRTASDSAAATTPGSSAGAVDHGRLSSSTSVVTKPGAVMKPGTVATVVRRDVHTAVAMGGDAGGKGGMGANGVVQDGWARGEDSAATAAAATAAARPVAGVASTRCVRVLVVGTTSTGVTFDGATLADNTLTVAALGSAVCDACGVTGEESSAAAAAGCCRQLDAAAPPHTGAAAVATLASNREEISVGNCGGDGRPPRWSWASIPDLANTTGDGEASADVTDPRRSRTGQQFSSEAGSTTTSAAPSAVRAFERRRRLAAVAPAACAAPSAVTTAAAGRSGWRESPSPPVTARLAAGARASVEWRCARSRRSVRPALTTALMAVAGPAARGADALVMTLGTDRGPTVNSLCLPDARGEAEDVGNMSAAVPSKVGGPGAGRGSVVATAGGAGCPRSTTTEGTLEMPTRSALPCWWAEVARTRGGQTVSTRAAAAATGGAAVTGGAFSPRRGVPSPPRRAPSAYARTPPCCAGPVPAPLKGRDSCMSTWAATTSEELVPTARSGGGGAAGRPADRPRRTTEV